MQAMRRIIAWADGSGEIKAITSVGGNGGSFLITMHGCWDI
jgi:hypothetical protein